MKQKKKLFYNHILEFNDPDIYNKRFYNNYFCNWYFLINFKLFSVNLKYMIFSLL